MVPAGERRRVSLRLAQEQLKQLTSGGILHWLVDDLEHDHCRVRVAERSTPSAKVVKKGVPVEKTSFVWTSIVQLVKQSTAR
jgi:hypothetical protein